MLTRKELKQNAKEQLRGKRALGVLITLVLFAVIWGAALVMAAGWGIGNIFSETAGIAVMAVIYVLWILLAFVLSTGYAWAFLKLRRGAQTGVGELFWPFGKLGKVLGVNVLMFVVFLVIYLVGAGIAALLAAFVHPIAAAIVSIALAVVLCYVMLGFAMTPYLLHDQSELRVCGCIKQSMRVMKGHRRELFVLNLSFFWWYLLTAITFGILILWVGPYIHTTLANYYDELVRSKDGETIEPEAEKVEPTLVEKVKEPEIVEAEAETEEEQAMPEIEEEAEEETEEEATEMTEQDIPQEEEEAEEQETEE